MMLQDALLTVRYIFSISNVFSIDADLAEKLDKKQNKPLVLPDNRFKTGNSNLKFINSQSYSTHACGSCGSNYSLELCSSSFLLN